jgi:hypothetical protein
MVMTDDGDAPWHGCARVRAERPGTVVHVFVLKNKN